MKTILTLSVLLIFGLPPGWELTPEDIQAQNVGLASLREAAGELAKNPSKEHIMKLAEGLRKTAMRNVYSIDGTEAVHQLVRNALVSVPGHAQVIADEVERFREEVQHLPRKNQVGYDREREWLLEQTLKHLPSPETIKVLGHYLDDERDLPPGPLSLPENSSLACLALSEIGLRDAPVKSRPGYASWKEAAAKQKAWYAQVKAGAIPFSFVGQKVEYRFKPDGTWETIAMINPPDDGPKPLQAAPVKAVREQKKQRPSEAGAMIGRPVYGPWLWVLAAGFLLIAGGMLARRLRT